MSPEVVDGLLSQVDVGEVWGIGRKIAPKLHALGFNTVQDLKRANPERLRLKCFTIVNVGIVILISQARWCLKRYNLEERKCLLKRVTSKLIY